MRKSKIKRASETEQNEAILNAKNFDELLDIRYGKIGTKLRDKFEKNAQSFINRELVKDDERLQQNRGSKYKF